VSRLARSQVGSQSATRVLSRILERPELVAVVDKLSAPVLGQLIAHVGLEDAGELVAAVTTQQLERIWERDLWSRPEQGGAERFDPERFALWLAVMLEAGEAQTVARLRELPFDLLTLAVHRLVRVVDRAWLEAMEGEDGSDGEGEGEGGPHAPWHELVLFARDEHAWDSVLTALLALDEEDHALLRRVLERCRDMDAQLADLALEEDQLYTALTGDAALESDVAAVRDARQGASGYLSAADAQSFLRLARVPVGLRAAQLGRDPIASAYFRELAPVDAAEAPDDRSRGDSEPAGNSGGAELSAAETSALASLLGLLADSGVLAEHGPALAALPAHATPPVAELFEPAVEAETAFASAAPGREAPDSAAAGPAEPVEPVESLLQAALRVLERDEPALWSERMGELGFLANAVLASGKDGGRSFDPRAALEASSALCSLGLELELPRAQRSHVTAAAEALRRVPADRLFRTASARSYAELTLPARRALAMRCERHGAAHYAELRDALAHDELGEWPEVIDHELLRLKPARWEALRALAEAIPRLAGRLATSTSPRFVTTIQQLNAAKRLLR
jgi:hypothetical protein